MKFYVTFYCLLTALVVWRAYMMLVFHHELRILGEKRASLSEFRRGISSFAALGLLMFLTTVLIGEYTNNSYNRQFHWIAMIASLALFLSIKPIVKLWPTLNGLLVFALLWLLCILGPTLMEMWYPLMIQMHSGLIIALYCLPVLCLWICLGFEYGIELMTATEE